MTGPKVTVNGSEHFGQVLVVLRPPTSPARIVKAEKLVEELTGRKPYSWCDGTGTWTIGDSKVELSES